MVDWSLGARQGTAALVIAAGCSLGCGGSDEAVVDGTGPSAEVTAAGVTYQLRQATIIGKGTLRDGRPAWFGIVSSKQFDRCHWTIDVNELLRPTDVVISVSIPLELGRHELTSLAMAGTQNSSSGSVFVDGSLEVLAIGPRTVTARIDGRLGLDGQRLRGTFEFDACGFAGQDSLTWQACVLPPKKSPGSGTTPSLQAVSPGGRVAMVAGDDALAVYERDEKADGSCSYRIAPQYGETGVVRLPKRYRRTAFDGEERLYVATEMVRAQQHQPGSLYRITPGGPTVSCRYQEKADASVLQDAPDAMMVLADGSAAYLAWEAREFRLDQTSPSLSERDLPCDRVLQPVDAARYTKASSSDAEGLLFVREIGDHRRAAVTDNGLVPLRYFGGSPSGKGEQGLEATSLLARCPVGYCVVNERKLNLFDEQGQFLQLVDLQTEFEESRHPTYFVQGRHGETYLRMTSGLGIDGQIDVVYKMTARK